MKGIQSAIEKAGGIQQLADLIGIRYQAVHKWTRGSVPAERVLQIEQLTGVSRHELRPDLYPLEAA
jgi:DNA-binding transcriptional regulator YdaS (Cro superfamily)